MTDSTRKTLRRSTDNRVLLGICGGLGEFFGINPIWFRLGFIIAAIPGGLPGILLYLILWLIIPKA
jgi:phage shock protein PspC (stress-responsive transcriptional regulator)